MTKLRGTRNTVLLTAIAAATFMPALRVCAQTSPSSTEIEPSAQTAIAENENRFTVESTSDTVVRPSQRMREIINGAEMITSNATVLAEAYGRTAKDQNEAMSIELGPGRKIVSILNVKGIGIPGMILSVQVITNDKTDAVDIYYKGLGHPVFSYRGLYFDGKYVFNGKYVFTVQKYENMEWQNEFAALSIKAKNAKIAAVEEAAKKARDKNENCKK